MSRLFSSLIIILISLGAQNLCHADNRETPCRYIKLTSLPVSFSGVAPTVEGTINGKPMKMLIDTGADNTYLFQSAIYPANLEIKPVSDFGYGIAGFVPHYSTWVDKISIGPLSAEKIEMTVILDSASLTYSATLGARFLFQHDMEMSLMDQSVKFFSPDGCSDGEFLAYWDPDASVVALDEVGFGDERKTVDVKINGHKLRALIDSGASSSIIYVDAAKKVGMAFKPNGNTPMISLVGFGMGSVRGWSATFDKFAIGGEEINNGRLIVTNKQCKHCEDMILGADFLRAHRVLFAVSQKRLYFSYLGGTVFYTDPKQDFALYQKAAALGSADALYYLSRMYEHGEGVEKNEAEALNCLRKAAELGDSRAQNELGKTYIKAPVDYAQAIEWFRKSADRGNPDGLMNLASMYEQGYGVEKDEAQAVALYQKMAAMGNGNAQFVLATMLENGRGVPKDEKQAALFYKKAADRGNMKAWVWLVRKDADKGNATAQYRMGSIYEQGLEVSKDLDQAEAWYRKSAAQNFAVAYQTLGFMLLMQERFSESANTLHQGDQYKPENKYVPLWLYLAIAHIDGEQQASGELLKTRRSMWREKWPVPIMDFYLGKIGAEELFSAASDRDENTSNAQRCEADFYIAEKRLLEEKREEAIPLLEAAERDCPRYFYEYHGAVSELKKLKLSQNISFTIRK